MTEWNVFLVIGAILGFLISVITPIIKLNGCITELTTNVKALTKSLDEYKTSNKEQHTRIWKELESHDTTLDRHETRLMILESKGGNK